MPDLHNNKRQTAWNLVSVHVRCGTEQQNAGLQRDVATQPRRVAGASCEPLGLRSIGPVTSSSCNKARRPCSLWELTRAESGWICAPSADALGVGLSSVPGAALPVAIASWVLASPLMCCRAGDTTRTVHACAGLCGSVHFCLMSVSLLQQGTSDPSSCSNSGDDSCGSRKRRWYPGNIARVRFVPNLAGPPVRLEAAPLAGIALCCRDDVVERLVNTFEPCRLLGAVARHQDLHWNRNATLLQMPTMVQLV